MDPGGAQEKLLVGGLHTLGCDLHAKTASETDDRMDNGRCVGSLFDRTHKAAVDLELVEGETAQIEQAGIASAEIIERKPYTQRLEPQHRDLRAVDIAEQHAFGQFQLEPGRIQAGLMQDTLDDLDEIHAPELQRRDVDGHHQIRPRLAIDAGATKNPVAEIDDQSAMLR